MGTIEIFELHNGTNLDSGHREPDEGRCELRMHELGEREE